MEENVLKELKKYFKIVKEIQLGKSCDIITIEKVSGANIHIRYYDNFDYLHQDLYWGRQFVSNSNDCSMVLTTICGKLYFFVCTLLNGNQIVTKNYLDFKELNKENVAILGRQLSAKNTYDLLPSKNFRLIKNIHLNDTNVVEGMVVYCRKFFDGYKLMDLSSQKSFDNLLIDHKCGSELIRYPNDEMDDFLLNVVKKTYPNATIKDSLFLFDCDYVFYRNNVVKDKKNFNITMSNSKGEEKSLTIELYYVANVFGRTNVDLEIGNVFNEKLYRLLDTYEPLSTIIL